MQNNKFKAPLLQSAAVLGAVIVLVLIVGSSGSSSAGGGIVALFSGIGNGILFAIGMGIALSVSIAILIGIFLGAVAMVDKDQAASMYEGLKKNFSASLLALNCDSCNDIGITEEEYEAMKEELTQLQNENSKLQSTLDSVVANSTEIQNNVSSLDTDNTVLKSKVDELTSTIQTLQESEAKINTLVTELSAKVDDTKDQELKDQIVALEQLQTSTKNDIETIGTRLTEVEAKLAKPTTPAKRTTAAKKTTATRTTKPRASRAKKKDIRRLCVLISFA